MFAKYYSETSGFVFFSKKWWQEFQSMWLHFLLKITSILETFKMHFFSNIKIYLESLHHHYYSIFYDKTICSKTLHLTYLWTNLMKKQKKYTEFVHIPGYLVLKIFPHVRRLRKSRNHIPGSSIFPTLHFVLKD